MCVQDLMENFVFFLGDLFVYLIYMMIWFCERTWEILVKSVDEYIFLCLLDIQRLISIKVYLIDYTMHKSWHIPL